MHSTRRRPRTPHMRTPHRPPRRAVLVLVVEAHAARRAAAAPATRHVPLRQRPSVTSRAHLQTALCHRHSDLQAADLEAMELEAAELEVAHKRVPLLQSPAAAQPRQKHRPMHCQSTPLPLLRCRPQPASRLSCVWMPCGPLAPQPALMQHASLGLLFRLMSACVGHASHRRQVSALPDCASSSASRRIVCSARAPSWMRAGCKT